MSKKECIKICERNGWTPYIKRIGKRAVYAYSRVIEGVEVDKFTLISNGFKLLEEVK